MAIVCTELIEKLKIDDPVGAVPVHGACGIWVRQQHSYFPLSSIS